MGVYLYTLRAKTTTVQMPTGPVAVHHMAYATKLGGWREDEMRAARAEAAADKAYAARKSEYFVIVGENGAEDGDTVFEGSRATWIDSYDLKAKPVGFLKKDGRYWKISDRTAWEFNGRYLDSATGLMVDKANRAVLVDGKITNEVRPSDNDRKVFVTLDEAMAKARARKAAADAEQAAATMQARQATLAREAAAAEAAAKAAEEAAQKALEAARMARAKADAARQNINQ